MQQPKGIAVVLGVLFGLVVVGTVVAGIMLFKGGSKKPVTTTNTNTALQLACNNDADCISYCGGDSSYQPICGVTTIGATGTCTCRSTSGPTVPSGNTNATTNAKANGNANVNASTNANTNSTVSTTSLKLYTNPQYSFQFKYPSVGTVSTGNLAENEVLSLNAVPSKDSLLETMHVYVYENPNRKTTAQWITQLKAEPYGPDGQGTYADIVQGESTLTIDGKAATKLLTFQFDHQNAEVYVAVGSKVYKVTYEQDGASNDDYTTSDRSVYEAVVSSFTFTK